jgi:hypothetical protein
LAHIWVHHNVSTLKGRANRSPQEEEEEEQQQQQQQRPKNIELGTQASKLARSQQLQSPR